MESWQEPASLTPGGIQHAANWMRMMRRRLSLLLRLRSGCWCFIIRLASLSSSQETTIGSQLYALRLEMPPQATASDSRQAFKSSRTSGCWLAMISCDRAWDPSGNPSGNPSSKLLVCWSTSFQCSSRKSQHAAWHDA